MGDLHKPHSDLEEDVRQYLAARGFWTTELTYHECLPGEWVRKLQDRWSPTALYIRGRADRLAMHPTAEVEFEWEAKTHKSSRKHDLCIEALPLLHHLLKGRVDVQCLYIYRNPFVNEEVGFWTDVMPKIREVHIPQRWDDEQMSWFHQVLETYFPRIPLRETYWNATKGSGDPYIIIDRSVVRDMPHWKAAVDSLLDRALAKMKVENMPVVEDERGRPVVVGPDGVTYVIANPIGGVPDDEDPFGDQ